MAETFSSTQLSTISSWLGSGSINIFGLPFSGKDTHGRMLAEFFDAPLISGGEILRSITMSEELRRNLDAGKLFPPDKFLETVTPYLARPEFENRPLILSSVGRWIGEEQGILKASAASSHPIKAAIYLHLAEDMVHTRFKASQENNDRGERADDAEHVLDTRIEEFNTKTQPVIDIYRKMGLLIEVNSDADRHEVLESILARLFVRALDEKS